MNNILKKRPWLACMLLLTWAGLMTLGIHWWDTKLFYQSPEVFEIKQSELTIVTELLPLKSASRTVEKSKSTLVSQYDVVEVVYLSEREKTCLIRNVFFESGAEPYEGKIAVAQVTWNRLKTGRWGNNICEVVYAKSQFSWTLDPNKRNRKVGKEEAEDTYQAVEDFLNGRRIRKLKEGLFFHATHVNPGWHTFADRIKQIGNHVFYALK